MCGTLSKRVDLRSCHRRFRCWRPEVNYTTKRHGDMLILLEVCCRRFIWQKLVHLKSEAHLWLWNNSRSFLELCWDSGRDSGHDQVRSSSFKVK